VAQQRSASKRRLFGPGRKQKAARKKRFRPRRLAAKAVLALVLLWLAACFLVVAEPTVNEPARADAIVVLGPPLVDGRLPTAFALAREHYANLVVISIGWPKGRQRIPACTQPPAGITVECFQPDPGTTRGEAEHIGALARARHWHSVLVVTSKYHVSRARLIVGRCVPGTVRLVAAPGTPSTSGWLYQFAYQTGGFAKALLHQGC